MTWLDIPSARSALAGIDPKASDFLQRVRGIWVRLPPPPGDPWSAKYRQHWLSVYRSLAGREYNVSSERTHFDVAAAAARPYPYCTESAEVVGTQLLAIGALIRAMNLPRGASILEMGPGWGNTSIALTRMGQGHRP